jgi:hypothetical protein
MACAQKAKQQFVVHDSLHTRLRLFDHGNPAYCFTIAIVSWPCVAEGGGEKPPTVADGPEFKAATT